MEFEVFTCFVGGVFGYLIGCFVISLILLSVLEKEIVNVIGLISFIPLGVFLVITFLIYFLSQFKVVRRE